LRVQGKGVSPNGTSPEKKGELEKQEAGLSLFDRKEGG